MQGLIRPLGGVIEHCNENPIYVFPEKELRGLSHNFYIHVSVSKLIYSPAYFPAANIGRPIVGIYINRSQTHECENWNWGERAVPFLGIHKSKFLCSVNVITFHCNGFSDGGSGNDGWDIDSLWLRGGGSLHHTEQGAHHAEEQLQHVITLLKKVSDFSRPPASSIQNRAHTTQKNSCNTLLHC